MQFIVAIKENTLWVILELVGLNTYTNNLQWEKAPFEKLVDNKKWGGGVDMPNGRASV